MGTGGRWYSLVLQPLSYLDEKYIYESESGKLLLWSLELVSISWRRCQRLSSWLPPPAESPLSSALAMLPGSGAQKQLLGFSIKL